MGDQSNAEYRDDRRRALGLACVPERREQAENLDRVSTRIAGAIVAFMRSIDGQQFHADELRRFVSNALGETAPDSAGRIMRDLRARGVIAYSVTDRARSLYLAGKVKS